MKNHKVSRLYKVFHSPIEILSHDYVVDHGYSGYDGSLDQTSPTMCNVNGSHLDKAIMCPNEM